ncbi:MAG: NfeD family protein [Gammaproteobacteria bacterium]|nr:MAG: NfeD family protein [Gammaproteobacteria bacterium]
MSEFITNLQYWHWWVIAIVCLSIEIFAPGAVFIWFSASAAVLGLLVWMLPDLSWQWQITLFGILSVLSILGWRLYRKKVPEVDAHPTLNKRGEELIGRVFTLKTPINDNYGKINVDDTMWKVYGNDCEVGQKVKVTSLNGTVLNVEHV